MFLPCFPWSCLVRAEREILFSPSWQYHRGQKNESFQRRNEWLCQRRDVQACEKTKCNRAWVLRWFPYSTPSVPKSMEQLLGVLVRTVLLREPGFGKLHLTQMGTLNSFQSSKWLLLACSQIQTAGGRKRQLSPDCDVCSLPAVLRSQILGLVGSPAPGTCEAGGGWSGPFRTTGRVGLQASSLSVGQPAQAKLCAHTDTA